VVVIVASYLATRDRALRKAKLAHSHALHHEASVVIIVQPHVMMAHVQIHCARKWLVRNLTHELPNVIETVKDEDIA
jgi:hypothetical protein